MAKAHMSNQIRFKIDIRHEALVGGSTIMRQFIIYPESKTIPLDPQFSSVNE